MDQQLPTWLVGPQTSSEWYMEVHCGGSDVGGGSGGSGSGSVLVGEEKKNNNSGQHVYVIASQRTTR